MILQMSRSIVSQVLGRALERDDDIQVAGSLVMTFACFGIHGLAAVLSAYRKPGFTPGVVCTLTSALLQATHGVRICARCKGTSVRTWMAERVGLRGRARPSSCFSSEQRTGNSTSASPAGSIFLRRR